jgi:hypothetical protein
MKASVVRACVCVFMLGVAVASAQVIPATPKKFGKRSVSNSGPSGASITTDGGSINLGPTTPASTKVLYTTHVTLSEPRQWKSTDGKSLLGRLIAFEDITTQIERGAPAPPFSPPANPTVVKEGKARLLIDMKPYEMPLDRLSQTDREFVEKIRATVALQSAAVSR